MPFFMKNDILGTTFCFLEDETYYDLSNSLTVTTHPWINTNVNLTLIQLSLIVGLKYYKNSTFKNP